MRLLRRLEESYKLDQVDWIWSNGHVLRGIAEGNVIPCDSCHDTFDEWIEIFLTTQLRQLHRAVEEGICCDDLSE